MSRFRTRGHAQPLAVVERAVSRERPAHALLLAGPAQVGKTTLALDLARGLLCLAGDPERRPCGACSACLKVEHGNHPDVHLLAPEGAGQQIRLGQVHSLAAELALLPLEGRFRVAIVQQAQRLNVDAQNALLKTLEEPPAAVAIVLAADDSASLLPTVVSRCATLRLGPVAAETIAAMLQEAGLADAARGELLARLSGGRPGLALALASQPEAAVIRTRLAGTLLSLLAAERRTRLAAQSELLEDAALLAMMMRAATRPAAELAGEHSGSAKGGRQAPAERRAATLQLVALWRDLARDLALAASDGSRELQLRELVGELTDYGGRLDSAAMVAFLRRLESLGRAVEAYANPELALDVLLLEWPSARAQAGGSVAA